MNNGQCYKILRSEYLTMKKYLIKNSDVFEAVLREVRINFPNDYDRLNNFFNYNLVKIVDGNWLNLDEDEVGVFEFNLKIRGEGKNISEAWKDASLHGIDMPNEDNIKVIDKTGPKESILQDFERAPQHQSRSGA